MSNRDIKKILAETVNANRMGWSRRIDDSLLAYHIAYKNFIGMLHNNLYMGRLVTYRLARAQGNVGNEETRVGLNRRSKTKNKLVE